MSNAEQIRKLEEQIAALRTEDERIAAMLPEQRLAVSLHTLLCHHNHVDGCGWEYESSKGIADWTGHSHSHYLKKAVIVDTFCKRVGITTENAVELMKLMNSY
jgi:hypothetical protein